MTAMEQARDFRPSLDPLRRPDRRREPLICKENINIPETEKDDRKKSFPTTPFKPCLLEKSGTSTLKVCSEDGAILDSPSRVCAGRSRPPMLAPPHLLEEDLKGAMASMDMHVEKEYAYEIFSNMMREQTSSTFKISDMPKRVTAGMRAILVDWLVQVHEYLGMQEETLYLSIYLMNLYLKTAGIRIQKLQLLGATCLFLACKIEECTFPEPEELCFMMEDTFDKKSLLKMERKVLSHLKFELRYTHPLHFLWLLTATANCSQEIRFLAMYFMELTLMEVDALTFEPAQLAAAGLSLAQKIMREMGKLSCDEIWDEAFKLYTYSDSELRPIQYTMVHAALRTRTSNMTATHLKYSRPQKLGASTGPAMSSSQYLRSLLSPAVGLPARNVQTRSLCPQICVEEMDLSDQ